MELRTINTFLHIAELHSFSRAARELGYSQSAVSSQIAQLEAAKRKEETQDQEPQEESGDAKISTFQFKTQDGNANGYAADWHPTAKTHDIAAAELTEYIKSLM